MKTRSPAVWFFVSVLLTALALGVVNDRPAFAVLPSGNGQTTAAKSLSVVFASDAAAITATVSGGATAALQTTGNTSLANIPSKGSTTMVNSMPVTLATNDTVAATLATAAAQATALTALNLLTMPKQTTAVTKSDATDTTAYCGKGLWVGGAGDVAVKMLSDSAAVTISAVSAGTFIPGQFLRIMSTNTTATNMICFGGTG